ncbi:MAG TPA: hypothetical protein VFG89_10570 [Coriobacteriia bacterium]|nr:hypothetical protein [Coriobacteriia bacterium]
MHTISETELTADNILSLLADASIEAQLGPEGTNSAVATVNDFTVIVEVYPEPQIVRVWTAMPLDPEKHQFEHFLTDTNRFNTTFLSIRNFVFQDPDDSANFQIVWDYDRLVGSEGLSSEMLARMISRLTGTIAQAFARNDSEPN